MTRLIDHPLELVFPRDLPEVLVTLPSGLTSIWNDYTIMALRHLGPQFLGNLQVVLNLKIRCTSKERFMSELILFYATSNPGQSTHEHIFSSIDSAGMLLRNPTNRQFSYAIAISGNWTCVTPDGRDSFVGFGENTSAAIRGRISEVRNRNDSQLIVGQPINGHVILFQHANLRGEHKHIFSGENLAIGNIDSKQFNDITSSFVILGGFWRFYRDQNESPYNAILGPGLYPNFQNTGNSSLGFIENDAITAVWPDTSPSAFVPRSGINQITLFENDNYLGRHKHVFTQEPNLASPDDSTFNDLTSSAWVSSGAWELFRHTNFVEPLQSRSGAAPTTIFRSPENTFQRIGNDALSSLRPLPTIGSLARIKHFLTNKTLHSYVFNYNHPGSSRQQQVTGFTGTDDHDLWRFKAPDGRPLEDRYGQIIDSNSVLRLEHFLTYRNLHSHAGIPSPVTGQQEVTCFGLFGIGDSNDNWKIEIEGGGPLRVGKRFKLIHTNTNHTLHSHPANFLGQQEVTGFGARDDNDWWVLTESFDSTHNRPILPKNQIVQRLSVNIKIGAEGTDTAPPFRGDPSDVVGYVRLRNSSQPIEVNFSQDQQWTPHSWHPDNFIVLPAETRLGDIVAFGIRSIHAGPDFAADNWSMDEIEVRFIGPNTVGILLHQQGAPIHLFLKNSNQFWEKSLEGDTLQPGQVLYPNHSIVSLNGRFRLTFQSDGNLVRYDNRSGLPTWSSQTSGPVGVCIMQSDGNLVIYSPGGQAIWSINDWHNPGSRLVVQDDSNVVIYRPDGTVVWATGW
jgi:Beta/Gamma crystallin